MMHTYKTKSVQERLWLINMAYDHGLIIEENMCELVVGIETEDDWVNYPYVVFYDIGCVDLRSISGTEVGLEELLELANIYPKSGLIVKHIKKHVL
jgi:hypothetical protein